MRSAASNTATTASFSFANFAPAGQQIAGVPYPRTQMIQYRGTTDSQLDLLRATRAMLGDETAGIESMFFTTIKSELAGQPFSRAVPLNNYLQQKIRDARPPLGELQAVAEAKVLVDKTFEFYQSQGILEAKYFDYSSSTYTDWPNDVVFTTVIAPAAATYGNRVVVVQDRSRRGLDLNYWNYSRSGKWYVHERDAGEFAYPGYIEAQDIIAYEIRSGRDKAWHTIEWVLRQFEVEGKKHIMVYDGYRNDGSPGTCMTYNHGNPKFCDYRPGDIALNPLEPSNESPRVVGIVTTCPNLIDCNVSFGPRSDRRVPQELINVWQSIVFGDQRVFFLPAPLF
jgi:hypothetical protein